MALTLYVDTARWYAAMAAVHHAQPDLVPVAKGNGYGFGIERLAAEAARLGADTLAVGTYAELPAARGFPGSLLVLTPWRPTDAHVTYDDRTVHTVGRLEDLAALMDRPGRPRVVLERLTSMRRHGFSARDLRAAGTMVGERPEAVRVEGAAFHLPLAQRSHLGEVERLMTDVVAAGLPTDRIYVSHLSDEELEVLGAEYPDFRFRPRIGTRLWLGDRGALRVCATVLDVHPVERGDVFGYRGRTAPRNGTILVVCGGTAHGIGLEAPTGGATLKDRAARIAKGGLDAAGFVRSPYLVGGKQRLFAEPPHMQASMLFLPHGAPVPDIGAEVDVQVRFTATAFDETVFSPA